MWEEHPEHQKLQAKIIGAGLMLLFVLGVIYCITLRDWHFLRQICLFAAAFVFSLALLSATGRLVVRFLTRKGKSSSRPNEKDTA